MTAPPLLLDTCAIIWMVNADPSAQVLRDALKAEHDRQRSVFVSPISAWEIGLLVNLGRLRLPARPERVFAAVASTDGIDAAGMAYDLLIASSWLPGDPPRDTADRIIIATAREYGLRVVTRDRKILDYSAQGHVMALAC